MTNEFDVHEATESPEATDEGRAARPRMSSLLDDEQRAAFLAEWESVQTGFAADPEFAAEAAERLVAALAHSVVRRIAEITDALGRPTPDPSSAPAGSGPAGVPAPDAETWRLQLLRCREAFHLLIDS